MVLLQIDSTSDVVFSTLNAGIGNLVWFWEASQAQKGRPRALKPLTLNPYFNLGVQQLIEKLGVERRIITAGDNKALMDPLSPMKDEDVRIIKTMLENTHKHFVDHVKKNRGERLKGSDEKLFNGGVWTGEPALELGLIDGIQDMDEYILNKYGDNVKVNRIKSKGAGLADLLGLSFSAQNEQDLLENFGKLKI